MIAFTQRKFQSLPPTQQHYQCAQLVRQLYDEASEGEISTQRINQYSELRVWMGLSPWNSCSTKLLADEYHIHLQQSQRKHKEHHLLPRVTTSDRTHPATPPLSVAIYLDNLRSAHNVGSIIRTVEAFSLGTIYFGGKTPTHEQKQVQDTAMGCQEWVTYRTAEALDQLPRPLIALETSPDAIPISQYQFPKTFTLAIGNEEYGCSDSVLQQADHIVTIPLSGRKNSLNVANAFAIAAAEIRRQHDALENS